MNKGFAIFAACVIGALLLVAGLSSSSSRRPSRRR